MASRKDVAVKAGVSEATVSRVLNGIGPMREDTKNRVLAAADLLGYHPSSLARSLARGRSGNLGVVLPYLPKVRLLSTPYFSEILSGIGEVAQEYGYNLLLLFWEPGTGDFAKWYYTQKVDACLFVGASDLPQDKEEFCRLRAEGLPFCLINQHFDEDLFNVVDANHEAGSYQAVQHLLKRGYERIAFLNGPMRYSNSRDRLMGYQRAVEEAGLGFEEKLLFNGNYSSKSGRVAARDILEASCGIDAVFAANDRMAIGFLQGCRESNGSQGREIPVVGYDNSEEAKLTEPSLTSVHVPFFEMGRLAANKLLDRLSREAIDEVFHEVLETKLVVRKSSLTH